MEYVIGVDLGTSAVKIILVNQRGELCGEVSKPFSIIEPHSGYSEQDPAEWADKTKEAIKELVGHFPGKASQIKGVSFSGQMHGLVLLNGKGEVLRNAILWNDTRTTEQCRLINDKIGKERLLEIAKNPALEGFTLPKLLWVKEYEKELFEKAAVFRAERLCQVHHDGASSQRIFRCGRNAPARCETSNMERGNLQKARHPGVLMSGFD